MMQLENFNNSIKETVQRALAEDIGSGDITSTLIPENTTARARVISRESAILCGTTWFECSFHQLDPDIVITWQIADGDSIDKNQLLCELHGNARALLSGERTALNFLQTLSGTATLANQYVKAVEGLPVKILDTRKTIPGLREAQKYAVRCGGCTNHRKGLYDGILIKENHIMACGSISNAIQQARKSNTDVPIEIEVENLDEVREALTTGADILLLDNFSINVLCEAIKINKGQAKLEASGGITLENIRRIAETGVDYISVGTLTKNLYATDLSMRFGSP